MPDETTNNVDTEPAKIEFVQFHRPMLKDGNYTITVEQTVQTHDSKIQPAKTFQAQSRFNVAGERFAFNPSLIYSVFPPEGSLGEHSNVLPHVILNRSTLPWERMADENREDIPWLALLLFDAMEAVKPRIMTLGELMEKSGNNIKWMGVTLETGQNEKDKVSVIEVEKDLLEKILPSADELSWLSHVRQGKNDKDELTGDELAVIIGNRLPRKGAISVAHLVSVEGMYDNGVFYYQEAKPGDLIRLVSLKSWSFACADKNQDFRGLLENLDPYFKRQLDESKPYPIEGGYNPQLSGLRLPPQKKTAPEAEKYLSKGAVPLPHFMRQGSKTISWYHGPLIPGENKSGRLSSPARAADELLRYNPSDGMFDVSYAAAWELGRLLALQSKKISIGLYQWKRAHVRQQKQAEQRALDSHLPEMGKPLDTVKIPADIISWFGGLSLLQGVPFNYLVPDERMLPAESIRFFRLDQLWVDCLLDGAFSIGRVTNSDHRQDQKFDKSPADNPNEKVSENLPPSDVESGWTDLLIEAYDGPYNIDPDEGGKRLKLHEKVSGCLLRSGVVSGWTDFLVEAYDGPYNIDPDKGGKRLKLLRMDRLSPNILLCLFSGGEMNRVEVHQKPESLHFGFVDEELPLFKIVRDDKGEEIQDAHGNPAKIVLDGGSNLWQQELTRSVKISKLAESVRLKLQPPPPPDKFTSAQFALQMIEGVEKVIFQV
jgi:hypothetical protein